MIIFVFKNGRFTQEEKQSFDFLIKNFKKEISDISLLVVTGCESLSDIARKNLVEEFHKNEVTSPIANFMKKGIVPVGFPSSEWLDPKFRDIFEESMKADSQKLQNIVCQSEEMRLQNEIFTQSFWEKCSII